MKRAATHQLTDLRRHKHYKKCPRLCRWSNNNAGSTDVMETLHSVMWKLTTFIVATLHLLSMALTIEVIAEGDPGADMEAIGDIVEVHLLTLVNNLELMGKLRSIDSTLFDISAEEDALPKQLTPHKDLRINSLLDPVAHMMTRFYIDQLRQIYRHFNFAGWAHAQNGYNGDERLKFYTGHKNQKNIKCYVRVHPEETFLFMMTKLDTGLDNTELVDYHFGGEYTRWSHIYKKTLKYVDRRYGNILGYQGLARYVNSFPDFFEAIEGFCMESRPRQELDGSWSWVEGLEFLPLDIIGFIDNSIDQTCVPCSDPRGDYLGAARKAEYDEMQRAFYTGYKKFHGIKYETILLPNGISTLFGPVSARHSDRGVLLMSAVNNFLTNLQNGLFAENGLPVFYSVLGDSAYRAGGLRCVQSYYRSYNGQELPEGLKHVNFHLKAARRLSKRIMAWLVHFSRYALSLTRTNLRKRNRMLWNSCASAISCSIAMSA